MSSLLPVLHVRGSHYEVGQKVGKHFKSSWQKYVENNVDLIKNFRPFYATTDGKKVFDKFLATADKNFPEYLQELEGMADGSGLHFSDMFLLCLPDELYPLLNIRRQFSAERCTSIFLRNIYTRHSKRQSTVCVENIRGENGSDQAGKIDSVTSVADRSGTDCDGDVSKDCVGDGCCCLLAHTEDAWPDIAEHQYVLNAEIVERDGRVAEKFQTLNYPATLFGYTSGVTSSGIVMTTNTTRCQDVDVDGVPCSFLNRACLSAKTVEHLLGILRSEGCPCASGFSLNIATTACRHSDIFTANIEVAPSSVNVKVQKQDGHTGPQPSSAVSIVRVADKGKDEHNDNGEGNNIKFGCYAHYNVYDRLPVWLGEWRNSPMAISSEARRKLVAKKLPILSKSELAALMSTSQDEVEKVEGLAGSRAAIFKVPAEGAPSATISTGLFDLITRTWEFHMDKASARTPIAVFNLPVCHEAPPSGEFLKRYNIHLLGDLGSSTL